MTLALLAPSPAMATVTCVYNGGSSCPDQDTCWYNRGDDAAIHVYFSNDMADTFRSCTPTTEDDSITDLELRRYMWTAASLWNLQARGIPLVFEGVINYTDPEEACANSMLKRPAIFVRTEVCEDADQGSCANETSDAIAGFRSISGCSDARSVEFYGNKTQHDTCAGSSTRVAHRIGSDMIDGQTTLKNPMGHELGHVLGLGHLGDSNSHTGRSVMWKGSKPHLWYWDKFCAEAVAQASDSGGRDVEYAYSERTASGSWSSVKFYSNPTERGFIASGMVRSSYGNPYYSLYTSYRGTHRVRYGVADTNGVLSFASTSTPNSALNALWTSPVFWSPLERDPEDYESNRANFVGDSEWIDPPYHKFLRTNGAGIFNSGYSGFYGECTFAAGSNCYSQNWLYGHLPMTAAYDDVSDTSMIARVNTNRPVFTSGQIFVHPGLLTGSSYLLRKGVQVPATNVPSLPKWDFQAKTDSPVGIACARDLGDWTHNCLVAWNDRSHPSSYVLYAFFKYSAGAISWFNNAQVFNLGWPASGGVSAAFMDDTFFLTWSFDDTVLVAQTDAPGDTAPGDWSVSSFSTVQLVDEPTFLYSPTSDREWGVIWTEVP